MQVPGVTEGSTGVTLKQVCQQGGRVLSGCKDRTQCPFSQFAPILYPSHHNFYLCEPCGPYSQ